MPWSPAGPIGPAEALETRTLGVEEALRALARCSIRQDILQILNHFHAGKTIRKNAVFLYVNIRIKYLDICASCDGNSGGIHAEKQWVGRRGTQILPGAGGGRQGMAVREALRFFSRAAGTGRGVGSCVSFLGRTAARTTINPRLRMNR
jgi:hypothetical protein